MNKLRDGARSVQRTIVNNFLDGSKQEAIDMLLLGNTFVGELGERARALLYASFLHCKSFNSSNWQSNTSLLYMLKKTILAIAKILLAGYLDVWRLLQKKQDVIYSWNLYGVTKLYEFVFNSVASPIILRELCDRHLEYTTWSNIRICVGTWNVNGGKHFRSIAHKHQTMHDWLLDFHKTLPDSGYSENSEVDFRLPTDVFAIGFEELVDLNASNIMSTRWVLICLVSLLVSLRHPRPKIPINVNLNVNLLSSLLPDKEKKAKNITS